MATKKATTKRRYLVTLTLEDPYTDDEPVGLKAIREMLEEVLWDNPGDFDVKKLTVKKETN